MTGHNTNLPMPGQSGGEARGGADHPTAPLLPGVEQRGEGWSGGTSVSPGSAPGTGAGAGSGQTYPAGQIYGSHPTYAAQPPGRTYASDPAYGGYGGPGQSGPPYGPGYGGYPSGSPHPPPGSEPTRPTRTGKIIAAVAAVVVLVVCAAGAGGLIGAWATFQFQGTPSASSPTIIDGPQLDRASLASIAAEVQPSVVSIDVGAGQGSGVVMDDQGHILTNAHVVRGSQQATVRFSTGERADATVVGADPRTDIAVVQARGAANMAAAQFGDSGEVLVGDTVLAIGSPLGFEGTVTQGIISALDRTLSPSEPNAPSLSGMIQTDAAINRGNSGGPLVNLSGEVIGINTAIATAGPESGFLGVGFAVPSNRALDVAQQLIAGEDVSHAYMGVGVQTHPEGGAVLAQVEPDSPAAEAGLREGDVVTRIGQRAINDSADLVSAVQAARPGDTLEVEFRREGRDQTTSVTLGEHAN